ncbi:glycosyltransferase [Methylocapsa polymorpha]|uniref:Glycosyltransferase n=1 Tax=Methylocapsa polymorpha TaxID=3080828 RepID=A0ABZ0HVC6_9HYPH|nr:glycosyltransferase [Methylocapsa sp. RX1]
MPSIDVAIPNYQYGRYLRKCVSSVLSQDVQDLRVLIIDNASKDDSVDIARELASKDSRVQVVVHPTNLGYERSLNEAIDWASSEYFMILCSDDYLAQGALARAMSVMEENPEVGLAFGGVVPFNNDNQTSGPEEAQQVAPWRISTGRQFIQDSCRDPMQQKSANFIVVRTSIQKQAGHFRPSVQYALDYEMMLRIANLGSVAETRTIQAFRRHHEMNISNDLDVSKRLRMVDEAFQSFFSHEGGSIPQALKLRQLAHRSLGVRAYWSGAAHLARGQLKSSADLFNLAFSFSPRTAIIPPVDYLFRTRNALTSVPRVIAEALHWKQTPAG